MISTMKELLYVKNAHYTVILFQVLYVIVRNVIKKEKLRASLLKELYAAAGAD